MKKINKKQIKEKAKQKAKKSLVPCRQKQCGLLNRNCPKCKDCGAEANMINEGCGTCFDCEYKPGCLRDGSEANNKNEEKMKRGIIMTKIPELRRLLMANGEVYDEPERKNQRQQQTNSSMIDGEDFEKQLKAEIIKQMASKVLANAEEHALMGLPQKFEPKEKGKGKVKDKMKEEPEEEVGGRVPYIG